MTIRVTKQAMVDEMIADEENLTAQLRLQLAEHEQVVMALRKYRDGLVSGANPERVEAEPSVNGTTAKASVQESVEEGKLPDLIVQVLRDASGPMKLRDISDGVELLGAKTQGERGLYPIVNAALLRRGDLFVRLHRGVYALADDNSPKKNTSGG